MALLLTGTAQHLDQTPIISAYPFSFACWFQPSAPPSANIALMSLSTTSGTENFFTLIVTSTKNLRAIAQTGASTTSASTSGAIVSSTKMNHGVAVFTNATSCISYLNGVVSATGTTSVAFTAVTKMSLGTLYLNTATAIDLWPGSIAYPTMWNVALSSTDVANLYNATHGVDPRTIQAGSVVSFSGLQSGPPYLDTGASTTWTTTGSPTIVTDPFPISGGGGGSLSVPQSIDGTTVVGSTLTGTLGLNTTTGNTIVVISLAGNNATISSIVLSSGSGTFTQITAYSYTASAPIEAWAAPNITGGTTPTVTITYNQAPGTAGMVVYEVAGMPSTIQTDGTIATSTGDDTAPTTGGITTTNGKDIIFGAFQVNGTITASQIGWTSFLETASGGAALYQIESTTQTALTAACTQSTIQAWGGVIFALKGTSSAGILPTQGPNPKQWFP